MIFDFKDVTICVVQDDSLSYPSSPIENKKMVEGGLSPSL
jgi:predicted AAA+ superfamily ATPase